MHSIPIYDLKKNMAKWLRIGAAGERVVITKHARPIAVLGPVLAEHLHVGVASQKRFLVPALRAGSRGKYLEVLADDREDARECR